MFFERQNGIIESNNSNKTMDINDFIAITEFFVNEEYDDMAYLSEGAASWEAMKIAFGAHREKSTEAWKAAKKEHKAKNYKKALSLYDQAITEAKKIYKVINQIPDENIYDFLVGFLPWISYGLWGINLVGMTLNKGKLKGASRAYAKTCNDNFIKALQKKRNECAEEARK